MKFKKILSAFLAAAISVSSISVVSSAQAPQTVEDTVERYQASGDTFTVGDFDYKELNDGTLEVKCNNRNITKAVIPAKVKGKSVTSIGKQSFGWCPRLSSVTLPNSVTSIGEQAFCYCTSLTLMTTTNSVTRIGSLAFDHCTSLVSVTITNSVTSIGRYAFSDCTSLTLITIPNSVTSIGDCAFSGCTSLVAVDVANDNKNYCSENGVLFDKDKTRLIQYPIGNKTKKYNIPNGVTKIDEFAFSDCTFLAYVTIPNSVTSIGWRAFDGCTSLTAISVDANNPNYCSVNGVLFDKDKTELIQYPIGNKTKSYTIPNSITKIDKFAFDGCTSLALVTIPDSVTSIGVHAFWETAWYKTQPDGLVYAGKVAYNYKGDMPKNTRVEIKKGTLGIAGSAFNACTGLTSVTIPNSVTNIADFAFYKCTSLKDVYYTGTEAQWEKISIGRDNDEMENATIHYNYKPVTVGKIANLKAAPARNSVKLTWSKNASAKYYKVFVWKNNKFTQLTQTNNNTTVAYTASNLAANTSYKFRVTAYNASNKAIAFSDVTAKTLANVANLKAAPSKNTAKITWGKNTAAKYYKVFVWKNNKFTQLTKTASNSVLNYTASKLTANTSYKFRVTAYNASNKAIAFSDISTKTLANIANLKAAPTKNSVKLTWSRNASAKYYKVFVWSNGKCQLLKQVNNSSAPNYTAAGLKLNTAYKYRVTAYKYRVTAYKYRVTAYNASNKAIAFSDISTKTLANIANLKAAPTKNSVKLTWSRNASAKYYKVFVWKNGKCQLLKQINNSSAPNYTAAGLKLNTAYKYRVTAYNASNNAIAFSDVTTRTLK